MQASDKQNIPDVDECCENIPPKVTAQVEDAEGSAFTQPGEENMPLSDAYTFSTPAPNHGKKEKSRLSGLQSALTPILKYLSFGNSSPSESLEHVFSTEKSSKSTRESAHHPSSDLPTIPSGKSRGGKRASLWLLDSECSPEITLLDATSDPTVEMTTNESVPRESVPVTPKVGKENDTKTSDSQKPVEKISLNTNAKTDIPYENKSSPLSLEKYLPGITLLEVSHDSELTPVGQMQSINITQDSSPFVDVKINKAVSELSEETESSDTIQNEELSSASVQSVKCVKENAQNMSLEVTQDLSSVVENSKTLSEHSEQNEKPQESDQEALVTKPVNITHEINSPHEMFVQCASSSTSGLGFNPSSESVISECESESAINTDSVEVVNEKRLSSCDSDVASKVSQQNSVKTDVCETGTITLVPPSNLSASSDFNSMASVSCTENKTLDLPAASPKKECESTDETQSATMKSPCIGNKNSSAMKESNHQVVQQNATFDHCSFKKSSGSTTLGEDVTSSLHLQNNTFDCKPPSQQNATITLSKVTSGDSHNKTLDKTSSPKVCSLTVSLKEHSSEINPAEMPKQKAPSAAAEPNVSMQENPNGTFEANPVSESVSGSGENEGRGYSESRLPVTDGLSDASSQQSVEMENNKPDAFNLDETLDLKADPVITSTPMPNCRINNDDKELEVGKITSAQKKLYGDGPSKVADPAPLNIVCDRKTFFTQHAPKFLKPPSKVTSQLLKNKPGSTLQSRLEPVTSCLPMKRQKTQPEPVRNAAVQEPQGTMGIPGSYNLRSITAASKLPSSGLQRPQLSWIPSVTQRAGPGLRPPSARSNTISSNAEKLCGPAAANAVTRNEQGKKHQLTRGEALPVKKRKKMDTVTPSSITEASAHASNATNKPKNMKVPTASQRALPAKCQRNDAAAPSAETSKSCESSSRGRIIKPSAGQRALLTKPQTQGCAKCSTLEEQLKERVEEIQKLKEELLKYKKQEDC